MIVAGTAVIVCPNISLVGFAVSAGRGERDLSREREMIKPYISRRLMRSTKMRKNAQKCAKMRKNAKNLRKNAKNLRKNAKNLQQDEINVE